MLKTVIQFSYRISLGKNNSLSTSYLRPTRCLCASAKPSAESKKPVSKHEEISTDDDEFRTIYRNQALKKVAVITRTNPYFVKACAMVVPPITGFCYWSQFIDGNTVIGIALIVTSLILPFQVFAFGMQRLVGFVYLNKESDQVKISYITYLGKREDIILPIENIMPFSDAPYSSFDYLYKKIRTFNTSTTYKIDMRGGEILDVDAFKFVFGDHTS